MIRLTLLLVLCFGGVVGLKAIVLPWPRHFALAVWFFACALLVRRFGRSTTDSRLLETRREVTWWSMPQSTFGVTIVSLYAAISLVMFTLGDAHVQWQEKITNLLADAVELPQILLYAVAVPVYEETFFRGSLLFALLARRGDSTFGMFGAASAAAIYMNGLVFWFFHAPTDLGLYGQSLSQGAVPIALGPFFLGLACALVASRDRSIWCAIILHGLANTAGPLWEPALSGTGLFDVFYTR